MNPEAPKWRVVIACGGTGGHLFPGLAVAQELRQREARVALLVSPKDVDQQGVLSVADHFEIHTLPVVAFSVRQPIGFGRAWWRAYRQMRRMFCEKPPAAVLAMGGFVGATPILTGRRAGALTFLHESNTIPGRANRWLGRVATECFVGFAETASRIRCPRVSVTGTPVRAEIRQGTTATARRELGLDVDRPVILIMGGSQGAVGVNRLVLAAISELACAHPDLQWIHLTGAAAYAEVDAAYRQAGVRAVVRPFSHQMELMLAAATVTVSRSGASSLAELAARRLPAVLIPYPTATDDHQRHNAEAYVRVGAARLLDQRSGDGPRLAGMLDELLRNSSKRAEMATALERLDHPEAAATIADRICCLLAERSAGRSAMNSTAPVGSLSARTV